MLNSHMSFASITLCCHVQGVVVVSESEVVLKLVGGQDCAVEITGVGCEPESSFTYSSSSVTVSFTVVAFVTFY